MLIECGDLRGFQVRVENGDDLGKVRDLCFDERDWGARFFIVRASGFRGNDLPIAVQAVAAADIPRQGVTLSLDRPQIEASPWVDLAKPVSQQNVEAYFAYFGWPYLWGTPSAWGLGLLREHERVPPAFADTHRGTASQFLRSVHEVTGYRIQATDDQVGHVEDLLIDPQTWTIRYLVVDMRSWFRGKRVLMVPSAVREIDWNHREVKVDLSCDFVRRAPTWEPGRSLDRDEERHVQEYYGVASDGVAGLASLPG